jgi:hypothetical protein
MKDPKTKSTYQAGPFMTLTLHHIPTKKDMITDAGGNPSLGG